MLIGLQLMNKGRLGERHYKFQFPYELEVAELCEMMNNFEGIDWEDLDFKLKEVFPDIQRIELDVKLPAGTYIIWIDLSDD